MQKPCELLTSALTRCFTKYQNQKNIGLQKTLDFELVSTFNINNQTKVDIRKQRNQVLFMRNLIFFI